MGKAEVRAFWESNSCGEAYASGTSLTEQLDAQARSRYALEPYVPAFAKFHEGRGRDVLEIGTGMGADHFEWSRAAPRRLVGVDLSDRAVRFTQARLRLHGATPRLAVSDVEHLPFPAESFDLVYSWGVLHHTPDTRGAVAEVWRVLRRGGTARVMVYHKYSIVGYLLWLRYAFLAGRPWQSLAEVYAKHLESPGTKAYSVDQGRHLFADFSSVDLRPLLSFSDLLEGHVGQRHRGPGLIAVKACWPRWLIRRLLSHHGLDLIIEAVK